MAFKPAPKFLGLELIKPTPKKGETVDENMREEFAIVSSAGAETTYKVGQKVYFKLYNVYKFVDGKNEYNIIAEENILASK